MALRDELAKYRDELVIATKGGLRKTDTGVVRDASPEWLRRGVDASLAALGLDYIDLYQVHWPDATVPVAETAGALGELIADGKIRHIGVSNYTADQILAAGEYISMRSHKESYEREISLGSEELRDDPEAEVEELALIYRAKGQWRSGGRAGHDHHHEGR